MLCFLLVRQLECLVSHWCNRLYQGHWGPCTNVFQFPMWRMTLSTSWCKVSHSRRWYCWMSKRYCPAFSPLAQQMSPGLSSWPEEYWNCLATWSSVPSGHCAMWRARPTGCSVQQPLPGLGRADVLWVLHPHSFLGNSLGSWWWGCKAGWWWCISAVARLISPTWSWQ